MSRQPRITFDKSTSKHRINKNISYILRLWAEKRALFNRKLKMVEFGNLLPMGPLIGPFNWAL